MANEANIADHLRTNGGFDQQRLSEATRTEGEIPEDIFRWWLRKGLDKYTYFARGKWTGRIKIGSSNNPWRRVSELIRSNNGEEADLLLTLRGQHLEGTYHRRFRKHIHGCEWFNPHPDILAEIDRLSTPHNRIKP